MAKKQTQHQFIENVRKIHNDYYDYSMVNYVNSITNIIIICPAHGKFEQQPASHTRGAGCRKCYDAYLSQPKTTKNEFIQRARAVHGDEYQYTNFVDMKTKVEIICPKHGSFSQRPQNHIRLSQGCPDCANDNKQSSTERFIQSAKIQHNDIFDYSLVIYERSDTKVKIKCNTHGVFEQTPSNHLAGRGCKICDIDNRKTSHDEFTINASITHHNKYDYSLANYQTALDKVKIICPYHGIFWQTPNNHISKKQDCPDCVLNKSESKAETIISLMLNKMGIEFEREVKFKGLINPLTNRSLRYDFYIRPINLLIEYDGKQHFYENEYFDDTLDDIKYRDDIKNDYAKEHDIRLLRIPYYINIEDALTRGLDNE